MKEIREKSNNELLLEIKEMEHEHETIKARILSEVTKMEEIEKRYAEAKETIIKRLKR